MQSFLNWLGENLDIVAIFLFICGVLIGRLALKHLALVTKHDEFLYWVPPKGPDEESQYYYPKPGLRWVKSRNLIHRDEFDGDGEDILCKVRAKIADSAFDIIVKYPSPTKCERGNTYTDADKADVVGKAVGDYLGKRIAELWLLNVPVASVKWLHEIRSSMAAITQIVAVDYGVKLCSLVVSGEADGEEFGLVGDFAHATEDGEAGHGRNTVVNIKDYLNKKSR